MLQAQHAFIEQIKRDRAGNAGVLAQIAAGVRFRRADGVDITAERRADAERRLADCRAILTEVA